ncbi:MAG: YggT family protein, partial [Aquificaceae bacterium]|nr:YggT family protein [Aquificaceae bacterium]MDW8433269.1 YggT family protein [Aquificaceae bacterium]
MIRGVLSVIINLLIILLFLHAIGSWVPQIRESRPYQHLDQLVSPILEPIRRLIPPTLGIDISPLILVLILYVIKSLL